VLGEFCDVICEEACGVASTEGAVTVSADACGITAPHFRHSLAGVADSKPQELHVLIIFKAYR